MNDKRPHPSAIALIHKGLAASAFLLGTGPTSGG
jgi:hypothetical protein